MQHLGDEIPYPAEWHLDVAKKLQPEYDIFLNVQEQVLRYNMREMMIPYWEASSEEGRAKLKEEYAAAWLGMMKKCWTTYWEELAEAGGETEDAQT